MKFLEACKKATDRLDRIVLPGYFQTPWFVKMPVHSDFDQWAWICFTEVRDAQAPTVRQVCFHQVKYTIEELERDDWVLITKDEVKSTGNYQ